jgi:predicted transcriptional regulator
MRPIRIFISSVQKELAEERRVIRDYVRRDALLHQFFDVFLFEDLPASDRRTDDVYLEEVGRCSIYMGILGNEYGSTDSTGLSPTEHELNERQRKAVAVVKTKGVITNSVYQQSVSTSRPTAIRDLAELVAKGVFIRKGTARSVHYILGSKRLIHDSSDSNIKTPANDSTMTHTTQMTSGASPENASNISSNISSNMPTGTRLALSRHHVEILYKCLIDTGITDLLEIAGRTDRTKFRNQVLNPLIKAGFLEMTIPDKPSSSKQKYRVTEEGRDLLEKQTKEAGADEK